MIFLIWTVWSYLHPCMGCACRAPGFLFSPKSAVVPWPAPEQRCFVPVNLQSCQFGTFPRSESREEGCCGQGTVSWQCCERPAGDTAALLLSVARLLLGCIFSASLPIQEDGSAHLYAYYSFLAQCFMLSP